MTKQVIKKSMNEDVMAMFDWSVNYNATYPTVILQTCFVDNYNLTIFVL